jgi:ATP-binding cassette subfamily F protein 3
VTVEQYLDQIAKIESGLDDRLLCLSQDLAEAPGNLKIQEEYNEILLQIEKKSTLEPALKKILSGLGLDSVPLDFPVNHLSGGQKTRLALAGTLFLQPDLLILDEPTNHLDIAMLEWLENWLQGFPGAVLVVSHDRVFLDQVCSAILELDPASRRIKAYSGNFSQYMEEKARERERQWSAYQDQLDEIHQLRAAAAHLRGIAKFKVGGKADTGDKFARGFFANRGKATIGRATQIEDKIEKILTEDKIDKPRTSWQMKVEFTGSTASGRDVLVCENLMVGYPDKTLLQEMNMVLKYGSRCCLLGPNGSGKTTFIRTILGEIPPLQGSLRLGSQVRPGYMQQDQGNLPPGSNALDYIQTQVNLNETEARSFLHKYLFAGDAVFTPISQLSYGERARLMLAGMSASGCNFLILDEPLNHLDIPSRNRFEQALSNFERTVLAVVHDRYFIHQFATTIWEITGDRIRVL